MQAGGVNELYCKNRRDAIIIFALSHGYTLQKTEEELYRFGEETINALLELRWWDWPLEKLSKSLRAIQAGDLEALRRFLTGQIEEDRGDRIPRI